VDDGGHPDLADLDDFMVQYLVDPGTTFLSKNVIPTPKPNPNCKLL